MVELALVSQVTLSAIVQHHGQEKIAGQVNYLSYICHLAIEFQW